MGKDKCNGGEFPRRTEHTIDIEALVNLAFFMAKRWQRLGEWS